MTLFFQLFPLLMVLVLILIIPCLIVGFWKKRPVWAFIVATLVMFLSLAVPGIIKTFQAMMIYGEGDPQLVAGGIAQTIVNTLFLMVVCVPLLWLFQWLVLRRHRRKHPKLDADQTFS